VKSVNLIQKAGLAHFMKSSIAVLIPTYREYENLPELTEKVWEHCPGASILIIDDASQDGTPAWVRHHARFNSQIFLVERSSKLGLGSAYIQGFEWALERTYEFIIQMDADLSHDPATLPLFLNAIQTSDLVLSSRYLDGVRVLNWPVSRLLLSMGAASYVRLITGMPFTDPTGGFKCWRRDLLKKFNFSRIRSNGYGFQVEMTYIAWSLNASIVEVPIIFGGRHAGASKMSGQIMQEGLWRVFQLALTGKNKMRKIHSL
jgi:dolichol-phosphate mannosyltransferase